MWPLISQSHITSSDQTFYVGLSVQGEKEEENVDGEDEEDEENDWMVPHGYLSEGEGCDDDDEPVSIRTHAILT